MQCMALLALPIKIYLYTTLKFRRTNNSFYDNTQNDSIMKYIYEC